MPDLAKDDRTKVEGQTTYPKDVLEQAKDENAIVNIIAAKMFDMYVQHKINKNNGNYNESPNKYFSLFSHNETNAVVRSCFALGENFRQGCELDLDSRLKTIKDAYDKASPLIIKPSAHDIRNTVHAGSVPGL